MPSKKHQKNKITFQEENIDPKLREIFPSLAKQKFDKTTEKQDLIKKLFFCFEKPQKRFFDRQNS
jgi:hypothetical protein